MIFRYSLVMAWLIGGIWGWCGSAMAASPSSPLYQVEGIPVSLAMHEGKEQPREAAISLAQKIAFQRLIRRLLTSADRRQHADFLAQWEHQAHTLVERSIARGEKRQADGIRMTVDLLFSGQAVQAALASRPGLAYNETLHPPVLLVVKEVESGRGLFDGENPLTKALMQSALDLGVKAVRPLGDLEDMTNLTWEALQARDPALLKWASGRYGVKRIWIAQVEWKSSGGKSKGKGKDKEPPQKAVAIGSLHAWVGEDEVGSPATWEVRLETGETARTTAPEGFWSELASRLGEAAMDQWIAKHAVNPEMKRMVTMRIQHGRHLHQYGQFLKQWGQLRGVSAMKLLRLNADEAVWGVDFQGNEEQMMELLSQLAVGFEIRAGETVVRLP